MEFLSLEAEEDGVLFKFSDDESEKKTEELDNFIKDEPLDKEDVSFYRERNFLNINNYPKFNSPARKPLEVTISDDESYFGEDEQPELYAPKKREEVTFDRFEGFEKSVENFKKTLFYFSEVQNQLFNAAIYGLMFFKLETYQQQAGIKPKKEDAQKVPGDELYFDLTDIEPETLLDKTLFGFFNRSLAINKVLAKHGFFLKFFERYNVYRFLIKTKYKEKMRLPEICLLACLKDLMGMR